MGIVDQSVYFESPRNYGVWYQKTLEMTDGIWTLTTQVVESELLPAIPGVLKILNCGIYQRVIVLSRENFRNRNYILSS